MTFWSLSDSTVVPNSEREKDLIAASENPRKLPLLE